MQKPASYNNRSGFTLIEILVVVAIIALLISILLPSLRAAREQGRGLVCGTQLNQIYKAVFSYTRDFKDVLPHMGFRANHNHMNYLWFTQINKYLGKQYQLFLCPSDQMPMQRKVAYTKSGKLKMADGTLGVSPGDKSPFYLDVSYQGACELLSDDIEWPFPGLDGPLSPMPRKITSFKRPAETILLVEGQEVPGGVGGQPSDKCMRYDRLVDSLINTSGTFISSPQKKARRTWRRHNDRSNFLFLDSRVERLTLQQAVKEMGSNLDYIEYLQKMFN